MHIVRVIVWVLLLAVLLIFSINNWNPAEVKIWEGLVLETKVPALVVLAFLLGLVPMWLLHRATKWQLHRRIASLEAAARASALAAANAQADFAPPSPPEYPPLPLTPEPERPARPTGVDEFGPR
jgi:uncharacterized integral membrane protein